MFGKPNDEALTALLGRGEHPCPSCGYNLRGVTDTRCPECGEALRVGLVRDGGGRELVLFLLVTLGWVFAAAAMNLTRQVSSMFGYARPVMVGGVPIQFSRGFSITGSFTVQGGPITQAIPTQTGSGANPTGLGAYAWSRVPFDVWRDSAWWAALLLLSIAGCLWAWWLFRYRNVSATSRRRLVRFAGLLFALYVGYHCVVFAKWVFFA